MATSYLFPINGTIAGKSTSPFGADRSGGTRNHAGADFQAPDGSKAVAVIDGKVLYTGHNQGYQWNAVVLGSDGNGYRYATHGPLSVNVGDTVKAGQPIGTIDRSHLHFEVIPKGSSTLQKMAANPGQFVSTSWPRGKNAEAKTVDPVAFFGVDRGMRSVAGAPIVSTTQTAMIPERAPSDPFGVSKFQASLGAPAAFGGQTLQGYADVPGMAPAARAVAQMASNQPPSANTLKVADYKFDELSKPPIRISDTASLPWKSLPADWKTEFTRNFGDRAEAVYTADLAKRTGGVMQATASPAAPVVQAALKTSTPLTVPPGIYGAERIVSAAMTGDPDKLKAAVEAVVKDAMKASAMEELKAGNTPLPNKEKIGANLGTYFGSVDDKGVWRDGVLQTKSPDAVREVARIFAGNPQMAAAVPEIAQPFIKTALEHVPAAVAAPAPQAAPPYSMEPRQFGPVGITPQAAGTPTRGYEPFLSGAGGTPLAGYEQRQPLSMAGYVNASPRVSQMQGSASIGAGSGTNALTALLSMLPEQSREPRPFGPVNTASGAAGTPTEGYSPERYAPSYPWSYPTGNSPISPELGITQYQPPDPAPVIPPGVSLPEYANPWNGPAGTPMAGYEPGPTPRAAGTPTYGYENFHYGQGQASPYTPQEERDIFGTANSVFQQRQVGGTPFSTYSAPIGNAANPATQPPDDYAFPRATPPLVAPYANLRGSGPLTMNQFLAGNGLLMQTHAARPTISPPQVAARQQQYRSLGHGVANSVGIGPQSSAAARSGGIASLFPGLSQAVAAGQAWQPTGSPGAQGGGIVSGPSGTFQVNGNGTYTSLTTGQTFGMGTSTGADLSAGSNPAFW